MMTAPTETSPAPEQLAVPLNLEGTPDSRAIAQDFLEHYESFVDGAHDHWLSWQTPPFYVEDTPVTESRVWAKAGVAGMVGLAAMTAASVLLPQDTVSDRPSAPKAPLACGRTEFCDLLTPSGPARPTEHNGDRPRRSPAAGFVFRRHSRRPRPNIDHSGSKQSSNSLPLARWTSYWAATVWCGTGGPAPGSIRLNKITAARITQNQLTSDSIVTNSVVTD